MSEMRPEHVLWCRTLFESLNPEGGIWGLPATGLIFSRSGDMLILTDRMPWAEGMPFSAEELREVQEMMYSETKRHFEAAGVSVRKAEGNGH